MSTSRNRVAILWCGDHEARRTATRFNNRYCRVFEELIALGMDAQPVIYADVIGLPAMLAGLWVGFRFYGKLDDAAFRKLILVFLLLAGLGLIVPRVL